MTTTKSRELKPISSSPYNIPAVKRYTYNETGNIMVATTATQTDVIQKQVEDTFQEVTVFFAAMTAALARKNSSIHNIDDVQDVVDNSGMFVQVMSEDVHTKYDAGSVTFSKQLFEALLGLASGTGVLAFADAMVNSIGQAGLTIGGGSASSHTKIGNIIFVCEYILGMPLVSAVVVHTTGAKSHTWFTAGPCIKGQTTTETLYMQKDTYLFVPPAAIKEYAPELISIATDQDYQTYISYLAGLSAEAAPVFDGVYPVGDTPLGTPTTQLTVGTQYQLQGANFGPAAGAKSVLMLEGFQSHPLRIVNWSDGNIIFEVTAAIPNFPEKGVSLNMWKTVPVDNHPTLKSVGVSSEKYTISAHHGSELGSFERSD